jgi:hypothetical protein
MELIAVGLATGIGTYVISEVNEIATNIHTKVSNYFTKEADDQLARAEELDRQQRIKNAHETYDRNYALLSKYKSSNSNKIIIKNNTEQECTIIFVNAYFGNSNSTSFYTMENVSKKDANRAIEWAKIVIEGNNFNGDYLNQKSTRVEILYPNKELSLLPIEFREYSIVVKYGSSYKIIEQSSQTIKSIFGLEKEDVYTDCECKFPWVW